MFSVYLFKKLFPIKHMLADSTAIHQNQLAHAPNLLKSFENYYYIFTRYSSTSLVNVDLSGASTTAVEKRNKSADKLDEQKSYTVSYLMKTYGFSRERAVSVSARTHFNNLEKPNSVLAMLRSYGFSDTQISDVVWKAPRVLVSKEKSILPKLEFFLSIGMSRPLLATFICRDPSWLQRSLDNLIIPNYNFLKIILLTDERVITAMKHNRIFYGDIEKRVAPNIKVLRELRVPESCITLFLVHYPEAIVITSNKFKESVSKVLEMKFDPLKTTFVLAIHAVTGNTNKVTWDQCYETYSSWGWSKEDIYMAFRKHPNCMIMSRNKISRTMDFLVNKIGLNARIIAQNPQVIFLSLEKRIIPRFSVIQVLLSKGLIKHFSLSTVLSPTEKYFLNKFVVPYKEEVPELYNLYKGKIGVME